MGRRTWRRRTLGRMAELVELAPCVYRSRMEAVELIMEGLATQPDPCPKPDSSLGRLGFVSRCMWARTVFRFQGGVQRAKTAPYRPPSKVEIGIDVWHIRVVVPPSPQKISYASAGGDHHQGGPAACLLGAMLAKLYD